MASRPGRVSWEGGSGTVEWQAICWACSDHTGLTRWTPCYDSLYEAGTAIRAHLRDMHGIEEAP